MAMLAVKRLHAQWDKWRRVSVNRGIFGAMITVALFTLLVKVFAVLKDMKVAGSFGIGDSLDIFLMAYLVPAFAISVFAGSFYSALIPVLVKVREAHGQPAAKRLFSSIAFIALVALGMVTAAFAVTDEWLIKSLASGFGPSKLEKTIALHGQMLPLILIGGMALFGGAVLNAHKKFALVAVAPIFTPFAIILVLLFFGSGNSDPGQLVIGTLIGGFLELCIVCWGLHKAGYLCLPKWSGLDEHSRKVMNQYLPMIGGAFLMSGTVVIDQVMAAWLEDGSVSILNYATKIPAFLTGLGATALGAAVLPYLSQQIAERDYVALKRTLVTYSKLILLLSVPVTLIGMFFSEQLIRLLFERDKFSSIDTLAVNKVLWYSLLQVPFYVLGTMLARFVSALQGNKFLLYVSAFNLLLNIILNLMLMKIMGIAGIALSTAIVYFVSTTLLCWISLKKIAEKSIESNNHVFQKKN